MAARGAIAVLPPAGDAARRLGIVLAVLLAGAAIGAGATRSPTLAVGAVVGVAFVWVAFRNLAAGLAFFVVLTFFERLPGSPATGLTLLKAAGFVLAIAWLAALTNRREQAPLIFRDHPWLAYAAVFFITWSLASMLWAEDSVSARFETGRLAQNVLFFFIVFTAISNGSICSGC